METLTSRKNSLITHVRKLLSSRSYRRECGEFVCDGIKLLEEAVKWGAEITVLIVTDERYAKGTNALRTVLVPEDVMASVSPMEAPQGALFVCRQKSTDLPARLDGEHYLVLDGLQDPGNVGTIWRTADALGCEGIILTGGCADPWNAKTVRATMGAAFRLPVYETSHEELAHRCAESDLPLYATALREDTVTLGKFPLERAAVVIGSEGKGVSAELLALCEKTIRIPMEPRCESLNAAAAAAVILWEWYRGRN